MKDIQKKDEKGLVEYVKEKREEVRGFRFGTAGAGTRNVRSVRAAKKEIARSLFELSLRKRTNSNNSAK